MRSVALAPWLFIPGLFIAATVLAYNFVGDGLRDVAAPYLTHGERLAIMAGRLTIVLYR